MTLEALDRDAHADLPDDPRDPWIGRLTGLDAASFDDLTARTWEAWTPRRSGRSGGHPYSLPFGSRVFLTVLHLRWGVSYRGLAAMFDVGRPTVEHAGRELRPLLTDEVTRHGVPAHQRGSTMLAIELRQPGLAPPADLLLLAAGSGD
jgi:hypothetical protein